MLALRAILFTILLPGVLSLYVPWLIRERPANIVHWPGLILAGAGAAGYFVCALEFLLRGGGTPALYLTRPLRFLIGEEPKALIQGALYRYTRNPMYVSVVSIVVGQAWFFAARALLVYALVLWTFFHLVVVFIEEPHLGQREGYADYCARVPRWLIR
jgi:hypothetical protein